MLVRQFLLWLPMTGLAFANAALREMFLVKHFSELKAQQLSTLTLIALCTIYTWFIFSLLHIAGYRQALLTGFMWLLLTVAFEFILGRVTGKSWKYLLVNYDLSAGHIWPVFLLVLFILPYLCFVIKNRG